MRERARPVQLAEASVRRRPTNRPVCHENELGVNVPGERAIMLAPRSRPRCIRLRSWENAVDMRD